MDRRRPRRRWLHAGLITLTLLAVFVFAATWQESSSCWSCVGSRVMDTGRRIIDCPECEGTGRPGPLAIHLRRVISCGKGPADPWRLVVRRNGVNLLECDPILVPVFFWLGLGVLTFVGLIAGLRGGLCPLCKGEGRILLEIRRPGRQVRLSEGRCAACEGKGIVTRIDRWVAGMGRT